MLLTWAKRSNLHLRLRYQQTNRYDYDDDIFIIKSK